jgi:kinetochore protein NNF1
MSAETIEKVRFDRLNLVCKKALEQLIKKGISMEKLRQCYPTISSTVNGNKSLTIARSQIVKYWHKTSLAEFDMIFSEKNIQEKLDELDEIIQLAQKRKQERSIEPVILDDLSPDDILVSSLLSQSQLLERLQMIYDQLCLDNQVLANELQELVKESNEISTDVNSSLRVLAKEVEILNDDAKKFDVESMIDAIEPS